MILIQSNNNEVNLYGVPGHCAILGNDEADELAQRCSGTPYNGNEIAIGVFGV